MKQNAVSFHQCTSYIAPLAHLLLKWIYLCKWMALCLSGNFQAFKDKLALWVALLQITIHNPTIDDTRLPIHASIIYLSLHLINRLMGVKYTSHLKVKKFHRTTQNSNWAWFPSFKTIIRWSKAQFLSTNEHLIWPL